jgi:hypothetical protein
MAFTKWVTTKTLWCERMQAEAALMEQRVYPSRTLPDFPPHRVLAQKCSIGTECNLIGFPCKWAYNNPDYDPFAT